MIKFKKPMVVYINQLDTDFIFRQGYSYMCDKIDNGYRVWNIDKSVMVDIVGDEVEEYLEE
jgi:hypothetical protein